MGFSNNQANETGPELTQILELADKDIKMVFITALPMFKKLSTDMKDIFLNTQIKLQEKKITVSDVLVFYWYIANYHKLGSLKQQSFISA